MDFIYYIDLLGTMVFAISGAMAANRMNIDVFGVAFMGYVTAIGGGSIRDLFLNIRPAWVEDGNYLIAIFIGVSLAILLNKKLDSFARALFLFDALGIGFFTVVGVEKSLVYESSEIAAVILGMFSACMGGVIRDVLMNVTPLILRKEIYASACLAGAITYVLLTYTPLADGLIAIIGATVVFAIRFLSVRYNLSLPSVPSIIEEK